MEDEKVFTGYCRQLDQTRMVLAEYVTENHTTRLVSTDCSYPNCDFLCECTLAQSFCAGVSSAMER